MQHSHTQLEVMENQLAGKQEEIEELSRETEEMRAVYGTEGLQQVSLPYVAFYLLFGYMQKCRASPERVHTNGSCSECTQCVI